MHEGHHSFLHQLYQQLADCSAIHASLWHADRVTTEYNIKPEVWCRQCGICYKSFFGSFLEIMHDKFNDWLSRLWLHSGPHSSIKRKKIFQSTGIPIIKISCSHDHFIFIMDIPMVVKHVYIENIPVPLKLPVANLCCLSPSAPCPHQ